MVSSIFLAILALGIIILVHEFGHFIAARLSGVKVEIFSIGFGPRVFGIKVKDVDYRVSLIPLGGYVKMYGDNPNDVNTQDPSSFYGAKPYKRAFIAFAGPFGNYFLALFISFLILMIGYKTVGYKPKVYVDNSISINYFALAGIRTGDLILKVGNEDVKTYQEFYYKLIYHMDENVEIIYQRGDQIFTNKVYIPKNFINLPEGIGIQEYLPPVVGKVEENKPAYLSGLKSNDIIISVNGKKVSTFNEVSREISLSDGKEVVLGIIRENKFYNIKVTPIYDERMKKYIIGIGFVVDKDFLVENLVKETNVLKAVYRAFIDTNNRILEIFGQISLLFSGKVDFQSSVAGPIRITYFLSNISNIYVFLLIAAFISLAIGIFNLFPIPGLDGWHIVISSVELIIGRKPSQRVITVIETIGFISILFLAVLIIFNDIFNIIFRDLKLFN